MGTLFKLRMLVIVWLIKASFLYALEFVDPYMRCTAVALIAVGLIAVCFARFFEQGNVFSHVGEVGVGLRVADTLFLVVI